MRRLRSSDLWGGNAVGRLITQPSLSVFLPFAGSVIAVTQGGELSLTFRPIGHSPCQRLRFALRCPAPLITIFLIANRRSHAHVGHCSSFVNRRSQASQLRRRGAGVSCDDGRRWSSLSRRGARRRKRRQTCAARVRGRLGQAAIDSGFNITPHPQVLTPSISLSSFIISSSNPNLPAKPQSPCSSR